MGSRSTIHEEYRPVADMLMRKRIERGLSRPAAAKLLGYSGPSEVYLAETSKSHVGRPKLLAYRDVYGLSDEEFHLMVDTYWPGLREDLEARYRTSFNLVRRLSHRPVPDLLEVYIDVVTKILSGKKH